LTDMAPLAAAERKGFFDAAGVAVELVPYRSWSKLARDLASGRLDAAQMLATQPLAAKAEALGLEPADLVAPLVMSVNGDAVTVSKPIWEEMARFAKRDDEGRAVYPFSAGQLLEVFRAYRKRGAPMIFGVDHPHSSQNYMLRYWLASAGGHPGFYAVDAPYGFLKADIDLAAFPPSYMPVALVARFLDGFAIAEPWGRQALIEGAGVPVVTGAQILPPMANKVLAMRARFVDDEPETVNALLKAVLRGALWIEAERAAGRAAELAALLGDARYVGADPAVLEPPLAGAFEFERGRPEEAADFTAFAADFASYPFYSDAIWYLTQMRRWGQISEPKPDSWYLATAREVFRVDVYRRAALELVREGHAAEADFPWATDGFRPPTSAFIDGIAYDARRPNDYLSTLAIGLKFNEFIENGLVYAAALSPSIDRVRRRMAARRARAAE
ncbi:MAG: CmpA/NrtA family ABC transporter substrate-binding protein, partial [Pseudomonadota bacterium]